MNYRALLAVFALASTASLSFGQTIPTNLLINGDAELGTTPEGWIISGGGTQIGVVATSHGGTKGFGTSYTWSSATQTISLLDKGFTIEQLDAAPVIDFSIWISSRGDAPGIGRYAISITLLDENNSSIDGWNEGTAQSPVMVAPATDWFERSYELSGYGSGLRSIVVSFGGDDGGRWSGYYGPVFDDVSVTITPSTVPEPAATGGIAAAVMLGAVWLRRRRKQKQ